MQSSHAQSFRGDSALSDDVHKALGRLNANAATEADKALLFANNDVINAAGINGTIPDDVYQKAQGSYASINEKFAADSAKAAGAEFTVQKSSSQTYVPGTDSDYITKVESKNQISKMQDGYNRRVNEYLKKNGVPQGEKWHNKLDVDFMADPAKITDPNEFREIAKLNNDAYKNRYAAEYERLSRAGGGKIGPEHVNGYMNEMNDFARKKGGKVDEILAKPASHLSNPKNRAELFQAMAQEQKYTSRMESLDDFLRAQEGLPPRNRGTSISKQGSNRSASNAANVRRANAVADASRFSALEDLAETMGQVHKNNPRFNPNAADDIARIVEGLPPNRRAGALSRIRLNGNPALVEDVVRASARAGRLPAGSTSLADDLIRSNSDELARMVNSAGDMTNPTRARRVMRASAGLLDVIGRLAVTAEVALAASQLREIFEIRERMLDPNISVEELERLRARAQLLANTVRDTAALGAIIEMVPQIGIAYGAWTVACMASDFKAGVKANSNRTCLDGHMTAFDRAIDTLTGKGEEREAHARALCEKFRAAVDENRIRLRGDYTEDEVCSYIRYGNSIADTYEHVPEAEQNAAQEEQLPPLNLQPAVCDPAENSRMVAELGQHASAGRSEAAAHIGKLQAVNAAIGNANAAMSSASASYSSGDIDATRSSIANARAALDGMGGAPNCADLIGRIEKAQDKVNSLERAVNAVQTNVEACTPASLQGVISQYGSVNHPGIKDDVRKAQALLVAHGEADSARASYRAGDLKTARTALENTRNALDRAGSGGCQDLRELISRGLSRIDKLENAIRLAEEALRSCKPLRIRDWQGKLANVGNAAAGSIKARLENYKKTCRQQRVSDLNQRCESAYGKKSQINLSSVDSDSPQCMCKKGFVWNKNKNYCIDQPSEAEQLAQRNRTCRQKFGSGYYSGPTDKNGQYFCIPNQQTANNWCNSNNPGSGYEAYNISTKGGFECRRNRETFRRNARADCKRQAKNAGKVYAYTQFQKNGSYNCHWCERGYRYKNGQCHPRQRQASSSGNSGGGGGGKKYACTIRFMDGSIMGTYGDTYSTYYTDRDDTSASTSTVCRRIR
ncbi:MAG: hypothetical protein AAF478_12190 [Pseudomonadota bacterium]